MMGHGGNTGVSEGQGVWQVLSMQVNEQAGGTSVCTIVSECIIVHMVVTSSCDSNCPQISSV